MPLSPGGGQQGLHDPDGRLMLRVMALAAVMQTQFLFVEKTLRVQVLNNHILTQNLHYNYYYPKPKYLIIGYMDPLGNSRLQVTQTLSNPSAGMEAT